MTPLAPPAISPARAWLLAARPATLPAAIVPVLVGTAAAHPGAITAILAGGTAADSAPLRLGPFLAALIASLLIQIGTNLANDVFDFHKGADTHTRLGPTRVTQSGLIVPGSVLRATFLTFGLAGLFGLYLVWVGGWPILVVGVLSILAGLAYTGGPWPLGYHGLGDVFVFIFFGVVAVTGSAYLQTGAIQPIALIASIPVGFLVTAILVVNNLRDIETDRASGKRTLAVRLGRAATRLEYATLAAGAYAVPLALWTAGRSGLSVLLPLLTFPLALRLIRTIERTTDGPTLNRALKQTGQLHLLFGVLFALGLLL